MPTDESPVRITLPTAAVLLALAAGHRWGFDIIDATGLGAGTVYPILRRLEEAALATSSWESAKSAQAENRPPRRYYRLTAKGTATARQAQRRYPRSALAGLVAGSTA